MRVTLSENEWENRAGKKRIFFLGAQPGDKDFLQTNGVFLC
jgi:hypothetical protein